MINNLNDFIFTEIESDKDMCNYSEYKILIENNNYKRILIKEKKISHNNLYYILENIKNLEYDIEYSLFSLDKEIIYDNKKQGGKLTFNIFNSKDTYDNKNINFILSHYPDCKNISLMRRFFFTFSILLIYKNYYTDKINANDNFPLKVINSIEGLILQKNEKNIKIVISFDENYSDNELSYVAKIIKTLIYINPNMTFKYNKYSDINKVIIIK